jgi:hypothetical protein
MSFYREHTSLQAAELVKHHLGQWMTVKGTIRNIMASPPSLSSSYVIVSVDENPDEFLGPSIYFTFTEPREMDRLKTMRRGDKLTAVGEIETIKSGELELRNCKIVGFDPK